MTEAEWSDHELRSIGMLLSGRATDEVDQRGRPVYGDTILLLLNGGTRSRPYTLPPVEWPGIWEELLNTARTSGVSAGSGLDGQSHRPLGHPPPAQRASLRAERPAFVDDRGGHVDFVSALGRRKQAVNGADPHGPTHPPRFRTT